MDIIDTIVTIKKQIVFKDDIFIRVHSYRVVDDVMVDDELIWYKLNKSLNMVTDDNEIKMLNDEYFQKTYENV